MARKTAPLSPQHHALLHRLGERLRLLRMRQRLSAKQVAATAGMSVMTLRSLERGGAGVTMGAYLAVMSALGIERDIEALAASAFDDIDAAPAGRALDPDPESDLNVLLQVQASVAAGSGSGSGTPAAMVPANRTDTPRAITADSASPSAATAPESDALSPPGLFDWLEAPARDLQRLIGADEPAPRAEEPPPSVANNTIDLFGDTNPPLLRDA